MLVTIPARKPWISILHDAKYRVVVRLTVLVAHAMSRLRTSNQIETYNASFRSKSRALPFPCACSCWGNIYLVLQKQLDANLGLSMQPTPAPTSPPGSPEQIHDEEAPVYPAPPQNNGSAPFSVLAGLLEKLSTERKPERRRRLLDVWFNVCLCLREHH